MPVSDAHAAVATLRRSHELLTGLLADLDEAALRAPSYDTEWTLAQVASHVGSQAEIFRGVMAAALAGDPLPGPDTFPAIWAVWDARGPVEQRDESAAENAAYLALVEGLDDAALEGLQVSMFGMSLDAAGLVDLRLREHAVHAWDVAVALDPSATLPRDAVDRLVAGLAPMAARAGSPSTPPREFTLAVTDPASTLVVSTADPVTLRPAPDTVVDPADATLTGDQLVRLVYGRLDPARSPAPDSPALSALRAVFPGV